jgi:hypothetical protein
MNYPDNIRAAFRDAALGLMEWQDPPLVTPREYRRLELVRRTWRPPAGDEIDPYDVQADWEERA